MMDYGNILALYLRDYIYHCFWVLIIEMLKCSDVSWYRDTFGVMHRYSCTLCRPISTVQLDTIGNLACFHSILIINKIKVVLFLVCTNLSGALLRVRTCALPIVLIELPIELVDLPLFGLGTVHNQPAKSS